MVRAQDHVVTRVTRSNTRKKSSITLPIFTLLLFYLLLMLQVLQVLHRIEVREWV
jgi:hypothetical protein